jgi:hypothetical protein
LIMLNNFVTNLVIKNVKKKRWPGPLTLQFANKRGGHEV